MFIKITESGGRRYAKLAEAYRDERGIGRQRIIANLGRVDALQSSASTLGNGLKKLSLPISNVHCRLEPPGYSTASGISSDFPRCSAPRLKSFIQALMPRLC
jgi:hypothetical protein